jgi:hypothetical protein
MLMKLTPVLFLLKKLRICLNILLSLLNTDAKEKSKQEEKAKNILRGV